GARETREVVVARLARSRALVEPGGVEHRVGHAAASEDSWPLAGTYVMTARLSARNTAAAAAWMSAAPTARYRASCSLTSSGRSKYVAYWLSRSATSSTRDSAPISDDSM